MLAPEVPPIIPPLEEEIIALALAQGFALAGVAPASPSLRSEEMAQWLQAGHHGEMNYLARHLDIKLDPRKLVEGAKSVVCVADFYPNTVENTAIDGSTAPAGRIARYAWGDDYHKIIKKRLFALADQLAKLWPGHTFRSAVDTAPVMEREHAANAGLGWIGKHTLVIHPRLGSWMLLGEIVTTLEVKGLRGQGAKGSSEDHKVDASSHSASFSDHCGSCTRCIDACPTSCIDPAGYKMDASRCISYLTIEHRGEIEPALHPQMGNWIAGCDICQEVCPFNAGDRMQGLGFREEYMARPPGPVMALLDVLNWDVQSRQKVLTRSALKRIKLEMFKRNALIAAGNYLAMHDDPVLAQRIDDLAVDETESELVRSTAKCVANDMV